MHGSFVHIARRHAECRPTERAFTFLDSRLQEVCSLTFSDIDVAARSIGVTLEEKGKVGDRALLLLPSGAEFVKGLLGCLYAGVIAVPAYLPQGRKPAHRRKVETLLQDAQARFILTDSFHAQDIRAWISDLDLQNSVECVTTSVPVDIAHAWQPPRIDSDSIALLQYTSGSTSAPKGVAVTHANLLANEALIQKCFREEGRALVVNWLPLYHDMGLIGNILQPLFRGEHAVSMAPTTFLAEPCNWLRAISMYRATTSGAPNFAYQLCANRVSNSQCVGIDLSSWRLAYIGSESIRAATLDAFAEKFRAWGFSRKAFYPCYGLAEATLFVSGSERGAGEKRLAVDLYALQRGCAQQPNNGDGQILVSCGSVSTGQHVAIVDAKSCIRCAEGQVGEIWVKHESVAAGYWAQPEVTARTFGAYICNESSGPFLRTGDLGFIQDDELYVTGRLKDLIVIHGRNHAPQDIEITAQECDSRLQQDGGAAFSVEREDEERLVLVQELTRRGAQEPYGELLLRIQAAITDSHGIQPYEIVLIRPGTLCRTTSGKIRRGYTKELYLAGELSDVARLADFPALDGRGERRRPDISTPYVLAVTSTERQIAAAACEVLGFMPGVDDNLFGFGLDSLAAARLVSRVRSKLCAEVSSETLYKFPTVRGFAEQLNSRSSGELVGPPLTSRNLSDPVLLSYAQHRTWFLDQFTNCGVAQNIPITLRIRGELNTDALRATLDALLERHEVLRSSFPIFQGKATVVIAPQARFGLREHDLRELPSAECEMAIGRLISYEVGDRFSLERGPLIRGRLIRLADREHALLLTLHHIVTDGWSVAVLIREMATLYETHRNARPSPLEQPRIQYADYATYQRKCLQGKYLEAQLDFWTRRFADAPQGLDLPADFPHPSVHSYRGARIQIELSEVSTGKLIDWSKTGHVTVFAALLTAANVVLSHWTGQKDIVLGTVVSGRSRVELESVIGSFVNLVPLRTFIKPQQTVSELVEQVLSNLIEARAYEDCPFDLIVEALNPPRLAARNPLFNVAFLYQNFPAEPPAFGDLDVEVTQSHTRTALLDLRFIAEQRDGRIICACEYSSDLFTAQTIARLMQDFEHVCEQMIEDSTQRVSSIQLAQRVVKSRVVIAANFTADLIEKPLIFWSEVLAKPITIELAPYDQIVQQLLDNQSAFVRNTEGVNVILLSIAEWLRDVATDCLIPARAEILRRNSEQFLGGIGRLQERSGVPILVCLCPAGAHSASPDRELLRNAHAFLENHLTSLSGVHCLTHAQIERLYPVDSVEDRRARELGHVLYSSQYFIALGTMIARRMAAIWRSPHKVIVVDCDDTLWKGLCGEDGPEGIEITVAHEAFQNFLVQQHEAGMLICLCSKNNAADIESVFQFRQDMRLRPEFIVAKRIGWQPKSQALAELADELQLGLESFIFIDDSAMECAEVGRCHPEVAIVLLPSEPSRRVPFLQHVWAFDRAVVTDFAGQRTQQYRQNQERVRALARHSSLSEFLSTLELHVDIAPMRPEHIARVAELTQRTNQFNLTTLRRQPAAVRQFAAQVGSRIYVVHVRDRFGDYGLVGALFLKFAPPVLVVDTFLLSCRVLGRRVEYRVLNELGRLGQQEELASLELRYEETAKNQPAYEFLQNAVWRFRCGDSAGEKFSVPLEHARTIMAPPSHTQDLSLPQADPPALKPQRSNSASMFQLIATEMRLIGDISRAITARFASVRKAQTAFTAPRSQLEVQIASIWAATLNLDRVGIHDDFFDIGGQSLLATQLISRISAECNIDIPLESLFEQPTVAAVAARIEAYRLACELVVMPMPEAKDTRERILI